MAGCYRESSLASCDLHSALTLFNIKRQKIFVFCALHYSFFYVSPFTAVLSSGYCSFFDLHHGHFLFFPDLFLGLALFLGFRSFVRSPPASCLQSRPSADALEGSSAAVLSVILRSRGTFVRSFVRSFSSSRFVPGTSVLALLEPDFPFSSRPRGNSLISCPIDRWVAELSSFFLPICLALLRILGR